MIRPYLYFFLFLFGISFLKAQEKIILKPKFEYYSLPNNPLNTEEISDIQIDNKGYVWIVSFKALYKYDGIQFKKITADYNSFGSLIRFYQGENGQRFVIDYWGAIYFVDNDSLFEYSDNQLLRSYYKGYSFSDIYLDKYDHLHIGYSNSAYRIVKNGESKNLSEDQQLFFNGYGAIFRNSYKPFLFEGVRQHNSEFNQFNFHIYNNKYELVDSTSNLNKRYNNPVSLIQIDKGDYLLSTGKGDLIKFNEERVLSKWDYPYPIIRLFNDSNNNLWLSTRDHGIHFFKNGITSDFNKEVYLPGQTAIVSAQDYQGGIWFYSQDQGLGYISHPEILFFNQSNNLKPLVDAFEKVGQDLYFTIDNDLFIYNQKKQEVKPIEQAIQGQIMSIRYDPNTNRLWISTRGHLYYLNNNKILKEVKYTEKLGGTFAYLNSDWNVQHQSLLGTYGYHYFSVTNNEIDFVSNRYPHKIKGVIKLDSGALVNTGNGLYFEGKDTLTYLGNLYKAAQKTAEQIIYFQNRALLSIPSEGVKLFELDTIRDLTFNGEDIPSGRLVLQNDSVMWVFSNYGSFRIETNNAFSNFRIQAYRALPRIDIKAAEIIDSNLYVLSRTSGIGVIGLSTLKSNKLYNPELIIDKVETKDKIYSEAEKVKPLSYAESNIQISFKSLDYHNLNTRYRYKLIGLDDDWNNTDLGYVNYASLSPGKYEFEVQSKFGLGNWSNSAQLNFVVLSPFWQKWWFILIVSLLLIGLAYSIVSFRIANINRQKSLVINQLTAKQKALRSRMDPHFLFNVISSLQYLILRKKNEKANRFLNQFSSILRNTLNQTDREEISIGEEIDFLKEYIELEKMRLEDQFDYVIELGEKVDLSTRIPTFLIQPFVENAIQHGLKGVDYQGHLKLKISREKNFLIVHIEDNGVGYNFSKKHKAFKKRVSYGIQTTKERLALYNNMQINSVIAIQDLNDLDSNRTGTIINLKIKTKKSESVNN